MESTLCAGEVYQCEICGGWNVNGPIHPGQIIPVPDQGPFCSCHQVKHIQRFVGIGNQQNLEPIHFTPERLEEANEEANKAATSAVEAAAEYERLKDWSDNLLSELKTHLEQGNVGKTSEARLERLARCSERWLHHINALDKGRLDYFRTKTEAKNAERTWMTIQSALSFIREGMKRDIID